MGLSIPYNQWMTLRARCLCNIGYFAPTPHDEASLAIYLKTLRRTGLYNVILNIARLQELEHKVKCITHL